MTGEGSDKISLMSASLETNVKERYRKNLSDDEYERMMVRMPLYTGPAIVTLIVISYLIYRTNWLYALIFLVTTSVLLYLDYYRSKRNAKRKEELINSYLEEFGTNKLTICESCKKTIKKSLPFCLSCGAKN